MIKVYTIDMYNLLKLPTVISVLLLFLHFHFTDYGLKKDNS